MSILLVFVIPIVIAIFPMVMDWLERAVVFPERYPPGQCLKSRKRKVNTPFGAPHLTLL